MKAKLTATLLILCWFALAFALFGCASHPAPATPSIAYVATDTARLQVAKARIAVEKIKDPADAQAAREAKAALEKADATLSDAGKKIEAMQEQAEKLQAAKEKAEARKNFWRGAAMKLALLCFGFAVWTFRKPLLLLIGL